MSNPDVASQPGRYVQANGIEIYYETHGSGEPLLLLHGGGANLNTMWDQHLPLFAQHFAAFATDSRGHGRTKNSLDSLSYRLMADDTSAFIRALGLDRPLVCGYSDGGQIALEMAMNYPRLARAYVIGAVAIRWTEEPYFQSTRSFGMDAPGSVDFERLERNSPDIIEFLRASHDPYQGHDAWKANVVQLSKMWLAPLSYAATDLGKISEPCLILIGDRDGTVLTVEQAVETYRMNPGAELAVVPGADHLFPFSKAQAFTQVVLDYLARKSPGGQEA